MANLNDDCCLPLSMTVSTMRFYASVGRTVGICLFALSLLVLPLQGLAEGSVRYAEIVSGEDGYVVNADIHLELNPRLEDAISRGVSLHFVAEFQIVRARWYWFDAVIVERSLHYRLSYHAITRTYRLSIGNLHQSFDNLDAAVRTMQRIRNWHIVDQNALESGVSYNAALRFMHDKSMLPRPFQVTAIGSRDWNLGTDWMRWTFLAGTTR
jgi:hypothetical protein